MLFFFLFSHSRLLFVLFALFLTLLSNLILLSLLFIQSRMCSTLVLSCTVSWVKFSNQKRAVVSEETLKWFLQAKDRGSLSSNADLSHNLHPLPVGPLLTFTFCSLLRDRNQQNVQQTVVHLHLRTLTAHGDKCVEVYIASPFQQPQFSRHIETRSCAGFLANGSTVSV